MIYTVTLNPAIDYVVKTASPLVAGINRTEKENINIGGKGINVSLILKELGLPSLALGFAAGFTGEAIISELAATGIETDFVRLKEGISRINVKIDQGSEIEINGQGPAIGKEDFELFLKKFDRLRDGDTLILAGSIPPSLPKDSYLIIAKRLKQKSIKLIVDTSKKDLLDILKYKPYLIKPNNYELESIFETKLRTDKDIIFYAKKMREMGAKNVLVSMAERGSLLIDEEDHIYRCGICRGRVINSVGAGDSMLAGFIAGREKNDTVHAMELAAAAGGATAFSSGLAKACEIERLYKELRNEGGCSVIR